MRAMTELLAADRAPAEIMDAYAVRDARRGRNDPCTCVVRLTHGENGSLVESPAPATLPSREVTVLADYAEQLHSDGGHPFLSGVGPDLLSSCGTRTAWISGTP